MGKRKGSSANKPHKKHKTTNSKGMYKNGGGAAGLYSTGSKAELKAVDTPQLSLSFTDNPTPVLVNSCVEGASFYNRIGRKISMKSLQVTGLIQRTFSNTAAIGPTYGRVLLVYDRQPNGSFPSLSDIILAYKPDGTTYTASNVGVNMNNRDRFKILMDERINLPPLGVGGADTGDKVLNYEANGTGQQESYNIKRYFKLNRLVTQFKASTDGSIGDFATGSLFMLTFSDITDPAQNAWTTSLQARLRFWDN